MTSPFSEPAFDDAPANSTPDDDLAFLRASETASASSRSPRTPVVGKLKYSMTILTRVIQTVLAIEFIAVAAALYFNISIFLVLQEPAPQWESIFNAAVMLINIESVDRLLFGIVAILFLIWIYQANANCRSLGAEYLAYTPAWAVASYFVPIVSFYFPFDSMREIWKASRRPLEWDKVSPSPIVAIWWGLYLATVIVGMWLSMVASQTITARAEDLVRINQLSMIFCALKCLLIGVFLFLLGCILSMQRESAKQAQKEASPGDRGETGDLGE